MCLFVKIVAAKVRQVYKAYYMWYRVVCTEFNIFILKENGWNASGNKLVMLAGATVHNIG